jgi:hypothetical protein
MATIDDVEQIETLQLKDFALDTSGIQLPQDRRLSDQEIRSAVDEFMASLRSGGDSHGR